MAHLCFWVWHHYELLLNRAECSLFFCIHRIKNNMDLEQREYFVITHPYLWLKTLFLSLFWGSSEMLCVNEYTCCILKFNIKNHANTSFSTSCCSKLSSVEGDLFCGSFFFWFIYVVFIFSLAWCGCYELLSCGKICMQFLLFYPQTKECHGIGTTWKVFIFGLIPFIIILLRK